MSSLVMSPRGARFAPNQKHEEHHAPSGMQQGLMNSMYAQMNQFVKPKATAQLRNERRTTQGV